jgi:hypothetical protein
MDGLTWAAGCGPTIALAGETLLVQGRRLRDYGLIEAEILSSRGNPFDLLRLVSRRLAPQVKNDRELLPRLFECIVARWCRVGCREVFDWLDAWPGRIFALWLAVRGNDLRRFTLDRIVRLSNEVDWPAALQAIELASGEDERATVDWLAGRKNGDDAAISWEAIYRRLAERPFGMTAEDVGNLTLRQLRVYLDESEQMSNWICFESAAELNEWRQQRADAVNSAVANLCQGLRWDARSAR